MQKYFEIFLVIFVLSFIIYFFIYKFYLSNFCGKYSFNNNLDKSEYLYNIALCKDSLVCSVDNIQVNNKNEAVGWQCNERRQNGFELDYYINVGNKYLEKSKEYINGLLGNG